MTAKHSLHLTICGSRTGIRSHGTSWAVPQRGQVMRSTLFSNAIAGASPIDVEVGGGSLHGLHQRIVGEVRITLGGLVVLVPGDVLP